MNEIRTQEHPVVESVFDNIKIFDEVMRMATALSKSAFVPKAFQNSPESCLVALDLARRLEVSPMTIFPHLYVIDAKPAFSTQFLITLVNRSGMFNRLDWETGQDGLVPVHYCDYQNGQRNQWEENAPNYYAVAKLTERRSGKTFTSPKVDVAFAELNGWTSKPGSKWRTMPEIMCAYRAASILIKRVCPELTLGMNFVEDVEDAAEDVIDLKQDVYIEAAASPALKYEPNVDEYVRKIGTCQNLDELDAVAGMIKSAGFGEVERRVLGAEWKERKQDLAAIADSPKTNETKIAAFALIQAAATSEQLKDVYSQIEKEIEDGRVSPDEADRIAAAMEARAAELETAVEPPKPTTADARQKANYTGLVESLKKCKTKDEILNLVKLAEGYVKNGMLLERQFQQFGKTCDRHAEKVLV